MPQDITLEQINLQEFDGDKKEASMKLSYVEYEGEHLFVLGDDDAEWKVNTEEKCDENTICKLTSGEETYEFYPISDVSWLGTHGTLIVSLNGGDYKITFQKQVG